MKRDEKGRRFDFFALEGERLLNYVRGQNQKKKKCEEEDVKKDWESWRHYDEWWESEGQEAFREYAGHRNAKAGDPPDRAE